MRRSPRGCLKRGQDVFSKYGHGGDFLEELFTIKVAAIGIALSLSYEQCCHFDGDDVVGFVGVQMLCKK